MIGGAGNGGGAVVQTGRWSGVVCARRKKAVAFPSGGMGGGGKEAAVKPWAVTAVGSEPGGRALLASHRVRWSGTRGNSSRELVSASGWTVALGQH
jgi:hypothetical protein